MSTPDEKSTRKSKQTKPAKVPGLNPRWWAPTMVALMVLGLLWLVVYYLAQGKYPIPGIDAWNLAIGFALAMLGFLMTTRWR